MHLVFVHGVAARREPDPAAFDAAVAERHRHFTQDCLEGSAVSFYDPYWGKYGAHADRDFASIPNGPGTALGGLGGLAAPPGEPADSLEGGRLLAAARADFAGTLNTLALTLVDSGSPQEQALAGAIGDYAAALDPGAGESIEAPAWLNDPGLRTDRDLLERLEEEARASSGTATLGLGNVLERAGRRILNAALDVVDGPAERLVRHLSPAIARFLGDVFIYLREGTRRQAIRDVIMADLVRAAASARADGTPLVVVGHSMGGIILFDMLTDAESRAALDAALGAPLSIDLLLTVGTQIGLFEELDLFVSSRAGAQAQAPAAAKLWWHVYNVMDVLSFKVDGVIAGASEFSVDTQANIAEAHTAYFRSPVFHKRLRKRLLAAGLLA